MEYPDEIKELFERYEHKDWLYVTTPEDWYPFVIACHKELVAIDPNYTIFQIKEKFGGLRYYFSTTVPERNDEMFQVTRKYEKLVSDYEHSKTLD